MVHILKKVGTPNEQNIVPFQPIQARPSHKMRRPSILVYNNMLPSNIVKDLVMLSFQPLCVSQNIPSLFMGWSYFR